MYDVFVLGGSAGDEQPSAGDELGGSAGDEQPSAGDGNKLNPLTKSNSLTKSKELETFFENETVDSTFKEFLADRKERKKAVTARATKMLVEKLKKLSSNPHIQVQIIKQSIERGWMTFFEIKQDTKLPNYQKAYQVSVSNEYEPDPERPSTPGPMPRHQ